MKKETDVSVSCDDVVSEPSMFENDITWDELVLARKDAVDILMGQQLLLTELSKMHEDKINNNKAVYDIIMGLLKTYNDLSKDIMDISVKHASLTTTKGDMVIPKTFMTGKITKNSDELLYISIASDYIAISEKVAHISSTVYIDILTKLGMDTTTITETYNESAGKLEKAMEK